MDKRDELRVFGEVVRKLRAQQGVSQEHLAASACLHRTYISLVERGLRNPSLTVIRRLAAALDIAAAELVANFEAAAEPETTALASKRVGSATANKRDGG